MRIADFVCAFLGPIPQWQRRILDAFERNKLRPDGPDETPGAGNTPNASPGGKGDVPSLQDFAFEIEKTLGCNCNIDAFEPESATGHSRVCRIHREALRRRMEAICGR